MRLLSRRLSDKKRYFTEEMVRKEQMQCEDEKKIRHEEVDLHGILNRLWIYQILR